MRLGPVIIAYQQKHDIEGKTLAAEIGISESTLCRIKQGKSPSAEGLAKIISWLCGAEKE